MLFKMTQHHIDFGTPKSSCGCPVALVIQDVLGLSHDRVSVSQSVIVIHGIGAEVYGTPCRVKEFIDAIDDGLNPLPIEFELDLDDDKCERA